jgi:D-glycero-D-manno-heptose 1,7-bisphosphate phosphatase
MLIIFDKDGTLVYSLGDRPPNTLQEQVIVPGVLEHCAELRQQGHILAVASNQGGVAFGRFSLQEAHLLVKSVADAIGAITYAVCVVHPNGKTRATKRESIYRKPNPGMIEYLMDATGFLPADTLYVGDLDTDRDSAQAAGVRFEWADTFFERSGGRSAIKPGPHRQSLPRNPPG